MKSLMTFASRGLVAAIAIALAAGTADAQLSPREKLRARLDTGAVAALSPILDAAESQGLPVDPLVQKALEGASKRAPTDRIVLAVRRLSTQLGTARTALGGAGTTTTELVAAASALQAGVRPEVLASLRADRPQASLAVPLGVLTELIARGVPADTGALAVTALVDAGVNDQQLVALRRDVERDISVGAPPTTALIARASGMAESLTGFTNQDAGRGINGTSPTSPARRRP